MPKQQHQIGNFGKVLLPESFGLKCAACEGFSFRNCPDFSNGNVGKQLVPEIFASKCATCRGFSFRKPPDFSLFLVISGNFTDFWFRICLSVRIRGLATMFTLVRKKPSPCCI